MVICKFFDGEVNRMKKNILTLLFVIVASLGAVALSACGSCGGDSNGGGNSETHNHVFGEYTVTQEATCTEDGYETATCTLCDETDTRVIPAKGHSWGEPAKVVPTCLDEGYTQTQCSVCKTTQKSEIVPATGQKSPKNTQKSSKKACFQPILSLLLPNLLPNLSLEGFFASIISTKS